MSEHELPAIELENVGLSFPIVRFRPHGLKEAIVSSFWRNRRPKEADFWALQDFSLTVKKNQVLGVVGSNGSGKSTLLKVIAGIYTPDSGRVVTRGRISSLLELGAGFREELTGYENIRLNGAILGFSSEEMDRRLPEIIDFCGIQKFLDQPLRTYSSGMKLRLGFAVASSIKPDILLIDEVLSVGDEEFSHKSIKRIEEMVNADTTVVIVSHNTEELKRLCQRLIWVKQGRILGDGEPYPVLKEYFKSLGY